MSGAFDFVGDVLGDVGDAVGDVVSAVVENPIVSTVASFAFPPAAPFLAGAQMVNAAASGNPLGVVSGAFGLDGALSAAGSLDIGSIVAQDIADFGIEGAAQAWGVNAADLATFADDASALGSLVSGAAPQLSQGMVPATWWDKAMDDPFGSAAKALKVVGALGGTPSGSALGTGAGMLGQYLSGQQAKDAASSAAIAQVEAAKIAAEAAKFKPVGVTTRFGQSQFQYDRNGNLVGAGYQLTPDVKAQQDALMGITPGLLQQYQGAQSATAPMGAAGQRAMELGGGYLSTTPQQQAAQYMAEQQALVAPGRERDLATLQNKLAQQGRMGLATGGTSTGMLAANPEMEAFYNAQRMQDLQLAAQATQGGMDYAKYGAGMVGTGGDLMKGMYGVQQGAFAPYKTALGGAESLEMLSQDAMNLGTSLGSTTSAAAAAGGRATQQGMIGAAQTMLDVNKISPWGQMLDTSGRLLGGMQYPQQQQQQYRFDPFTGQQIRWG